MVSSHHTYEFWIHEEEERKAAVKSVVKQAKDRGGEAGVRQEREEQRKQRRGGREMRGTENKKRK